MGETGTCPLNEGVLWCGVIPVPITPEVPLQESPAAIESKEVAAFLVAGTQTLEPSAFLEPTEVV